MAVTNIRKLCREWWLQTYGMNQDVSDDDFRLQNLRLTLKRESVKWKKTSSANNDRIFTRKTLARINAQVVGQTATAVVKNVLVNERTNFIFEGLNETVIQLPLNEDFGLTEQFGKYLEINPSKVVTEMMSKNPLTVKGEKRIGPGVASADVERKDKELKAEFQCELIIEGIAIKQSARGVVQCDIAEIVKELKERYPLHARDDLDTMRVNGRKVELSMKGEVQFRWQCEHAIIWN